MESAGKSPTIARGGWALLELTDAQQHAIPCVSKQHAIRAQSSSPKVKRPHPGAQTLSQIPEGAVEIAKVIKCPTYTRGPALLPRA